MTRRILVMKTGSTLPPILEERGDYESWIAAGMGLCESEIDVCAVYQGEALPAVDAPAGVVVTGSPAMVSHREPWSEASAAWLARAVEARTPVLGICYGHQLLAHALGGEVGPNPRGREMGTVTLQLESAARDDPLLGALPDAALIHTTHVEAVLRLPSAARSLARSAMDAFSAFAVGPSAWGVQFHPEFDAAIMRGYVDARRQILLSEGLDPDAMRRAVVETPESSNLLRRFADIARAAASVTA